MPLLATTQPPTQDLHILTDVNWWGLWCDTSDKYHPEMLSYLPEEAEYRPTQMFGWLISAAVYFPKKD